MNRSKILDRESKWFFWSAETFDTADGPGFVLPEGLSAVHMDDDLYFERDRDINAFLSLDAYFREATEEEVVTLIEASPLEWGGDKPIQDVVSKRCKRLMHMFVSQGGFDNESVSIIGVRDVATEIGMQIRTVDRDGVDTLVLPDSPGDITHVFEILTEHYSTGIWDGLWRRHNSSEVVSGQDTTQN